MQRALQKYSARAVATWYRLIDHYRKRRVTAKLIENSAKTWRPNTNLRVNYATTPPSLYSEERPPGGKRVILDCDIGTDDAVALHLLLFAETLKQVKIEMIVCSRGNTSLHHVCRNCVRLLETAHRTDIPVYRGSYETMIPYNYPEEFYHGVDGFGDLKHDREPKVELIRREPAVVAMQRLIAEYPREITLICIGPLTNLAMLLRMYETVAGQIKEIFLMGGNILGVGNVTQSAEFNFHTDPEAAHVVLTCAKCPLTILPWETCLNTNIPCHWRISTLAHGGDTWKLIGRAEHVVYNKSKMINWLPCDAFLVASYLYPEMILKQVKRNIAIELNGTLTRGQAVIDHINKKPHNASVIETFDSQAFKNLMQSAHKAL